jgi:hypothetical protein
MSTVPYIFAGDTGNIPLSQLDDNFANVKLSVDFVIQNTQSNITSVGTLTALSVSGNVLIGGILSVAGNTIHGNIQTAGFVSASGNVIGANILTAGIISATGNAILGNVLTSGSVSAAANVIGNVVIANVVSASTLNAANVSLTGNLVVAGNATVNGTTTFINTQNLNITDKNITIANGVSTSALIDGAGIDAGNPTVAYIRYSNASQGWTTANNFTVGSNLIVSGTTAMTGVATAPTAANTVANTQIATTAFVRNIIPTGVITLWYGSIAGVPSGWFLCDGTNGTPDLRDRFIVGAGSTYPVASTGGSTDAVVVGHTHTATSVVTDPGHSHTIIDGQVNTRTNPYFNWTGTGGASVGDTGAGTNTATTGITVATTVGNAGSSGSNANLPPYYALAYIMKA